MRGGAGDAHWRTVESINWFETAEPTIFSYSQSRRKQSVGHLGDLSYDVS